MNWGEERVRATPTYTSSVFERPTQTPKVKRIKKAKIDGDFEHSSTKLSRYIDQAKEVTERSCNQDGLIIDRPNKTTQEECHDTPFQRLYKEVHGPAAPKIFSSRNPQNLATNLNFNSYSNKLGVYENWNAKQRRLIESDSWMWAENGGNYKSFQSTSPANRIKFGTNISFLNKHTEVVDNTPREINPSKAAKEQLQSHIFPSTECAQVKKKHKKAFDALHELEKLKEQQNNMKSPGIKNRKESSSKMYLLSRFILVK